MPMKISEFMATTPWRFWSVFHSNGWAAGDVHCHISQNTQFSMGVNGTPGGDLLYPVPAVVDQWYHVAYVLTRDTVTLYVNGVLTDSKIGRASCRERV